MPFSGEQYGGAYRVGSIPANSFTKMNLRGVWFRYLKNWRGGIPDVENRVIQEEKEECLCGLA
jgi:hypothetical protein